MSSTAFKFALLSAIAVASVAAPLVLQYHGRVALRERDEALRRQADRLAQLTAENQRLAHDANEPEPSQPLSREQLEELLRLRSEMGRLREQTDQLQKLRAENRGLEGRLTTPRNQETQQSPEDVDEQLRAETLDVLKNISRGLGPALQRFASEHTNRLPSELIELRNYFPPAEKPIAGWYSIQFVPERPSIGASDNALTLREIGEHRTSNGKWARFYAFGDGRIVEAAPEDEDFDAWEKQHMIAPPAPAEPAE
jgi:hypothetical protein